MTLLSTIEKTFRNILNDRVGTIVEKEDNLGEGQAGFRPSCSSEPHVETLSKIIRARKDAGLPTYCFFLEVQACDIV